MTDTMEKSSSSKHQFAAEVSKVLKMMIHSVYKNKDIFLREFISNASDACDKLRFEALTKPELLGGDELKITISVDDKAGTICIADNGIGMNRDELIANLGTIARSGTAEFADKLASGDKSKPDDISLIGQFGVGFYSGFMVADEVIVETRKAGSEDAYIWRSSGDGEFEITEGGGGVVRGTRITLVIKEDSKEYLDKFRLQHIITSYSDHIMYPIHFVDSEGKSSIANDQSAIWTQPKASLTEEKYNNFYKHVSYGVDNPWMVIHNKNEGTIEYTNLLFIPTMKPFDLFHPDRTCRVKLYVKRVFIADEGVDLIPRYMRFLRGVIDCEDLPLNISRETLQHNALVEKIKSGITKRVLQELKKKADKDPVAYEHFMRNFGAVIKEGLCEPTSPRQEIMEVCRFESTRGTALVGFDEYIANAKPDQEDIYYFTAESREQALNNPLLDGFISQGYEVLLLVDHVDDFWVNVANEYKGKKLKSITRSDIKLSENTNSDEAAEASSENSAAATENIDAVISALKTLYGEEVKDVVISHKLFDIPAVLSSTDGQMDFRFERFLHENKQLQSRASKVLEINPSHPVIKNMCEMVGSKIDKFNDYAQVLLDQAKIIAGEDISDRKGFAKRLCALMQ